MRTPYAIPFFLFCLCLGLWVNQRSWNGLVFVYIGEQRSPAAVRSLHEFSALDQKALHRSVEAQLLAYAEIYKDQGLLGVQLGHPLLTGKNGGKEFSCQVQDVSGVYDRVEIVFVGTGVSQGGGSPRMIIDSRCHSEGNLNQLDTVWIPMQTVLLSQPKDQAFELPGENSVKLRFENIPDGWPENWVMWNVRFYKESNPEESLVMNAEMLKLGRPTLLSFDWKVQ